MRGGILETEINFDIEKIKKIVQKKTCLSFFDRLFKKKEFGLDEKQQYKFDLEVLQQTVNFLKNNKLYTKEDWKRNNIPITQLIKNVFESAMKYAEIKKYYEFQFYERRKAQQI